MKGGGQPDGFHRSSVHSASGDREPFWGRDTRTALTARELIARRKRLPKVDCEALRADPEAVLDAPRECFRSGSIPEVRRQ